MMTLHKLVTELKAQSLNEIIGGETRGAGGASPSPGKECSHPKKSKLKSNKRSSNKSGKSRKSQKSTIAFLGD